MLDKFVDVKPEGHSAYLRRVARIERRSQPGRLEAPDVAQAAAGDAGSAGLGNNTKSRAAIHESTDQKTGEYQRLIVDQHRHEYVQDVDAKTSAVVARSARFAAQGSAAKLMHGLETPRGGQWRVTACSRRKVGEVRILYSAAVKKAHFGGLMVCGSVWTCPPCAAKISERRKNEVKILTDLHKEQGGFLYMATHTFSHQREQKLAPTMVAFSKARQHMRSQRAYKELRKEMGYVGDIRALEITYGDANGFHPHEHDLWLVSDKLTAAQLRRFKSTLFRLWHRACLVSGLGLPNRKRGVDVLEMESAAEYLAKFGREPKWGVASELAKQHVKKGKVASLTPFDLLRRYHDGEKRFGALFLEFARAFFGKRQLVWSDGLRQLAGIVEMSDEEIAVLEAEDAQVLVKITGEQWWRVLRQPFDVRALLLDLAENGGHDAVMLYLHHLEVTDYVPPF